MSLTTRSWVQLGLSGGGLAAFTTSTSYPLYVAVTGPPLHASVVSGTTYVLRLPQLILARVIAALLAAALTRWTTEPRRWFLGLGIIVGLMAIISPLTGVAAAGDQLVLALIQATAALVIVTTIRPRVPLNRP